MEELFKLLEQIYSEENNEMSYDGDHYVYFKESELTTKIESLCCEHLIDNGGHCNWENIWILRNNGYRVFAGEKDSFGWLTGCIQKNDDRRILVYG